jgi:NAD(P)-dependent dehydrogenase (short-subunit alcohol dehydrogenase family)
MIQNSQTKIEYTLPTLQKSIGSPFSAASTAAQVIEGIDLRGKVAVVTGGYSGIGLETVRILCSAGAKVIVPARDPVKAKRNLSGIDGVEIDSMDLLDPRSIDAFASRLLSTGQPLHILINNAGIMGNPLTRDSRGYESQFATNHLGHFQLVMQLWPALRSANGARVVAVSSRGHRFSPVVFEDPNFEHREYDLWLAYGQSKTANILFALELDKRGRGDKIRAFSVHPGTIVNTNLSRYIPMEQFLKMGVIDENGNPMLDPLRQIKTVEQGASTIVWCATNPQLEGKGGVYCENNDITFIVKNPDSLQPLVEADSKGNYGLMPYAVNPESAERLWALSEKLIFRGQQS